MSVTRKLDVAPGREPREQGGVLEHQRGSAARSDDLAAGRPIQPGDLVVTTARPGMYELALYATPPAIGTFPVTMSKQPPESVPKKHGIDIIVLANHTVYEADTGFELFDGPTMICDPRLKR